MRFSFVTFHALTCALDGLAQHTTVSLGHVPGGFAHDEVGRHTSRYGVLPCYHGMAGGAQIIQLLRPFGDRGEDEDSERGAGAHLPASGTRARTARALSTST